MKASDDLTNKEEAAEALPSCSCSGDPFASLPPDLQPKKKSWKANFRHVTCPSCGKEYYTNLDTDLCSDCR
ncbi:MAG: hypothetical protein R6U51_00565 [Anaerolineales bacterium]